MRLLYAVVSLPLKLTLEIAGRAASAVGLGRDEEPGSVAVYVPPQPNYVRPSAPPRRKRSGGNGGAPPVESQAATGAGPEVHVDEPWPGYSRMTAAEIKDRLRVADTAVAAAVSLYEAAGKGRSSVLEAAARRVRLNAPPSG